MRLECVLVVAAALLVLVAANPTPKHFAVGQEFHMQCKNAHGEWSHGPICHETGKEMTFRFGTDDFVRCGWHLNNNETYHFAARVIRQDHAWQCRIPMSADAPESVFWIPLTVPLWGVVEHTHLHLNYHMNVAFHADSGLVIGAAAYPVRDKFQFGKIGSLIGLHAPIRWFDKHSFTPFNAMRATDIHGAGAHAHGHTALALALTPATTIALYCALTLAVAGVLFTAAYHLHLRPALIKHLLKKD